MLLILSCVEVFEYQNPKGVKQEVISSSLSIDLIKKRFIAISSSIEKILLKDRMQHKK